MNKAVGLVGLGLIGSVLARRLMAAGFDVVGYDIDAARRSQFAAAGGRAADSVAAIGRACSRVVIAVFTTDQVEQVIEGTDGLISATPAQAGPRLVVNVATCDPDRVEALAARVARRGIELVEFPISGSSQQIAEGDGVGLVGGEPASVSRVADILEAICARRHDLGAAGNGARAKLAVNLILGLNRAALAEGLACAESLGLDPGAFLEIARDSAAYSQVMDIKGAKMVHGDFSTQGKIVQTLKDFRLIVESAARAGQALPLAEVYIDLVQGCADHGEGDEDNSSVIREIRRRRIGAEK